MIFILEIVGAVAFGLSGAFVAVQRRLDYFGVFVLSLVTVVGGGMLRDIILGSTPPAMFRDPVYCIIAAVVALGVIIFNHFEHLEIKRNHFKLLMKIIMLLDAAGLSIYSIIGVNIALKSAGDNIFLAVFVGVLTGIGGGMLRDTMVGRTPLVLRREIYALASIVGSVLYYSLRLNLNDMVALYISVACIFIIRVAAAMRGMHLPSARRFRLKEYVPSGVQRRI